jgi:hypothetical protein
MLVKLSLFAVYYRLFEASRSTRVAIFFGAGVVALFYTAFSAVLLALCVPRRGEGALQAGAAPRCVSAEERRFVVLSTFNTASDVYLFVVPVRIVWGLRQLPRARKLALTALFLIGVLYVWILFIILFFSVSFRPDLFAKGVGERAPHVRALYFLFVQSLLPPLLSSIRP